MAPLYDDPMFTFDLGNIVAGNRQAIFPGYPLADFLVRGRLAVPDTMGVRPRFVVKINIQLPVFCVFAYGKYRLRRSGTLFSGVYAEHVYPRHSADETGCGRHHRSGD